MPADPVIMEALARIEHKLDLLLKQSDNTPPLMTKLGDVMHRCPVCNQQVDHQVDIVNGVVTRKCGCATGKIAPVDLGAFAPPAVPARERDNGRRSEDEEDGGDAPRRRGDRGR